MKKVEKCFDDDVNFGASTVSETFVLVVCVVTELKSSVVG